MDLIDKDFFKKVLINNSDDFISKIEEIVSQASAIRGGIGKKEKMSLRREANVLTKLFFRDTNLENAHATHSDEILTYTFVENLLDETSQEFEEWLIMRDDLLENIPTLYYIFLRCFEVIKSLESWNQDPIVRKNNEPININLFNYKEYNIETLSRDLSNNLKNNSISFICNVLQYCHGAIKLYQNDIDLIYEREISEARVIAEYCFARSIPTDWFGKDLLTDSNMKELMIFSSSQLTDWLIMRDTLFEDNEKDLYYEIVFLLAAALDV
ncbi:hypothetical protein QA612_20205 [Evansella sp. AB-P1]|uniref:hypothetical protein n=1 Tax=Evansella sp. AB-P1 TaxID=3037653 RepID=UPI00241DA7DD|nr:hypothetical protein [Evansella sp. AB-P1]MDG5789785.1 hypothetical protein [Evansella sp. AB-P1]